MISTSTIRISCVVHEDDVERAVQALHARVRAGGGEPREPWRRPRRRHRRDRPGRHRDAAHPRGAHLPGRRAARVRVAAFGRPQAAVRGRRGHVRGAARRLLRRPRPRGRRRRRPASRSSGRRGPPPPARMVVDNSAAFRMDPDVPLVVAEVNPDDLRAPAEGHRRRARTARRWCRSPRSRRCTAPRGIDRMVVSTYQSVSGAGQAGHARARRAVDEARRPRRRRCAAPARSTRRSSRARCGTSRSPAT